MFDQQDVNFKIPDDWLTAREAAKIAPGGAMTTSNMTNLLRRRKIKGHKRNDQWWVDPVSLKAYRPERSSRQRISAKLP